MAINSAAATERKPNRYRELRLYRTARDKSLCDIKRRDVYTYKPGPIEWHPPFFLLRDKSDLCRRDEINSETVATE